MCTLTCALASRRSSAADLHDLGRRGVLAESLDGDARDRPRRACGRLPREIGVAVGQRRLAVRPRLRAWKGMGLLRHDCIYLSYVSILSSRLLTASSSVLLVPVGLPCCTCRRPRRGARSAAVSLRGPSRSAGLATCAARLRCVRATEVGIRQVQRVVGEVGRPVAALGRLRHVAQVGRCGWADRWRPPRR